MRFEIVINQNGAYFFRLASANGNVLASSEAYSSKAKCIQTVKAIAKEFNLVYNKNEMIAEENNE